MFFLCVNIIYFQHDPKKKLSKITFLIVYRRKTLRHVQFSKHSVWNKKTSKRQDCIIIYTDGLRDTADLSQINLSARFVCDIPITTTVIIIIDAVDAQLAISTKRQRTNIEP